MAKIQSVHIPAELKNIAINGGFDFWQRVAGNTSTVNTNAGGGGVYAADMVSYGSNGQSVNTYNYSISRSSSNVPSQAQSGFVSSYSYQIVSNASVTPSNANSYIAPFDYRIEGYDYERIHNKVVTFGFWFYGTVAGTYSFALRSADGTRSYIQTFTVGASTWTYITFTVQMDSQTSSYTFSNANALDIYIGALGGANYQASASTSWQTTSVGAFQATGATVWTATSGATINIAQFSIVEGPLGFGATGFLRAGKTIQQELSLCQRYYEKSAAQINAPGGSTGIGDYIVSYSGANSTAPKDVFVKYSVVKRTSSVTTTVWDSNGTINKISEVTAADSIGFTGVSPSLLQGGDAQFRIDVNSGNNSSGLYFQFASEAGL